MTTTLALRPAMPTTPSQLLAAVIEVYQRYISPRKGFSCAYRVSRSRKSCSEFARRLILRRGITQVLSLMQLRFAKCAAAAQAMNAQATLDYESKRPPTKSWFRRLDWNSCKPESSDTWMLADPACCCAAELAAAACA